MHSQRKREKEQLLSGLNRTFSWMCGVFFWLIWDVTWHICGGAVGGLTELAPKRSLQKKQPYKADPSGRVTFSRMSVFGEWRWNSELYGVCLMKLVLSATTSNNMLEAVTRLTHGDVVGMIENTGAGCQPYKIHSVLVILHILMSWFTQSPWSHQLMHSDNRAVSGNWPVVPGAVLQSVYRMCW